MTKKKGLLLLNLGTPDRPEESEVRTYLKEFLMDPYVIDIPYAFRWLLVNGFILRSRPAASAEAYRKVWTDRGSPLLYHLEDLTRKVRARLSADQWTVMPAMRYGKPTIAAALSAFEAEGITEVLLFPLYPQYSLAATESSLVETRRIVREKFPSIRLESVPAFYDEKAFIRAFAHVARNSIEGFDFDHMIFSFHGLPERQVKKTDPTGAHCLGKKDCCDIITDANRDCYRAQCFATAKALAQELGLKDGKYTVAFQSRLGRTPWTRPFTDELYQTLPKQGVKRVAVMSPAFVADCLETLEEIQIRGREDFIRNGGEDLKLVPSLNSDDVWADAIVEIASRR